MTIFRSKLNLGKSVDVNKAWLFVLILSIPLIAGACSMVPDGDVAPEKTPAPTDVPVKTQSPPDSSPKKTPTISYEEEQAAALVDKIWVLIAHGNPTNPIVVEDGILITAEFTSDGALRGSGGCNNYQTFYELDEAQLTVEPIASTKMACENGMDQETAYFEAIQAAESFEVTPEGRLEIVYNQSAGYETRLIFTQGQTPFEETVWILKSFGDPEDPTELEVGTSISAIFSTEGVVSGNSGCNNYSAAYAAAEDGGGISINIPVTTGMACPAGMEQEALYLDTLSKAESFRIAGSRLEISYGNGAGVLVYTSMNFPLEGTLWTLVSLNGGPVAENAPLTMLFDADEKPNKGRIGGVVGCNNFKGNYEVTNNGGMAIGEIATTFMACSPEVMEIEQSYINALNMAESYQILGNQLTINSPLAVMTFSADRTPLEGTYWVLISAGDADNPQPPVEGSNFAVQFVRLPDAPTGTVQGTTGCKIFKSAYVASLTEIKVNPVDIIESQECPAEVVEQEQVFFLSLSKASTYQILGNLLTIDVGSSGALNFVAVPPPVEPSPDLTPLNGTFWFLESLNGQAVVGGTQITALFSINADRVTGSVSGSAGCNNYNMNILEGFNFAPPAVTEVHCDHPAGVMEQEQLYLDMLRTARAYSITDEQLLIITTNGPLVFSSTPPETLPDPSVLLVDRTWFLSSINNNAVVPGSTPSAYFGSDGSLSGHTGCNLYAARFLTNLSSITITPIVSTEDPCEEPLKSQERAFINALQAATEYKVTSTSLQLIGIKGILNFTSIPVLPPRPTPTPLPPSTPTPTAEPEETEEPSPTRTSEAETETPEPTIPQAVITAPEDGFEAPVDIEILFDASDSSAETSIKEYQWDFGDDSLPLVSTKPALEYFYSEAGSYVVTLIIVDMNDVQSDPVTITITITDQ